MSIGFASLSQLDQSRPTPHAVFVIAPGGMKLQLKNVSSYWEKGNGLQGIGNNDSKETGALLLAK